MGKIEDTRSLSPVMLQNNSLLAPTEVFNIIKGVDVTAHVCPVLYYVPIREYWATHTNHLMSSFAELIIIESAQLCYKCCFNVINVCIVYYH